jgi:enoyl-CoA hydratase/carnithine racemase
VSEQPLHIERQERVALLTMHRPDRLNALNLELRESLIRTCQELRQDDSVWAVVLTGAGRGFCAGVDLRDTRSESEPPGRQERLDVYGWVGRLSIPHAR